MEKSRCRVTLKKRGSFIIEIRASWKEAFFDAKKLLKKGEEIKLLSPTHLEPNRTLIV